MYVNINIQAACMQQESQNLNHDRTERTKSALRSAMRKLALEQGFAGASTPAIVKLAGVTRGALYHHYSDKRELFKAVVEDDCRVVADAINRQRNFERGSLLALKGGAQAFISAMAEHGRARIILIEAPSVLGRSELIAIEDQYARGLLRAALEAAIKSGVMANLPLDILTGQLSAMFDSASLDVENGKSIDQALQVVNRILEGLCV